MKHRASSLHRMDAPDRHSGLTNNGQRQTDVRVSLTVCLSVCVLDGVWHYKTEVYPVLRIFAVSSLRPISLSSPATLHLVATALTVHQSTTHSGQWVAFLTAHAIKQTLPDRANVGYSVLTQLTWLCLPHVVRPGPALLTLKCAIRNLRI